MPAVSVVIPVHNGGERLRISLGSVVNQTLTDIEVFVVDDGSTDRTAEVITEFAATDPRVHLVTGPAIGSAGAARNAALDLATGDYLSFLDADDFFAPTMLADLHRKAVAEAADIVITRFRVVQEATGDAKPVDWGLLLNRFPPDGPVHPQELGDHLFEVTNPAPWNKIFRTGFIRTSGLRFQHTRRTNDAYFTYLALALAQRISVVDAYLIDYLSGHPTSLQSTTDENPLEFVVVLQAMRDQLVEIGSWPRLERAFVNRAAAIGLTSLKRITTPQGFAELHQALRSQVFGEFGIIGREPAYFLNPTRARDVAEILTSSTEELLFKRLARSHRSLERLDGQLQRMSRQVEIRTNAQRWREASRSAAQREPAPSAEVGPEAGSVDQVDISVVIAVHNTARYLSDCLNSVTSQTGIRVEAICVDDGSDDSSGAVLDELATTDQRIKVIHQENSGLSVSRNVGLQHAKGRYVSFLDSDDRYNGDCLAELVARADTENLDLLLFDADTVREDGISDRDWERRRNYYRRAAYPGVHQGPELLAAMHAARDYRASACLYLINRKHLERLGLRFYPGIVHEDDLFTFELLLGSRRVGHQQLSCYSRRLRPGSIMTTVVAADSARGYLTAYLEMQRVAGRKEFPEPVAAQVAALIADTFGHANTYFKKIKGAPPQWVAELDGLPETRAAVLILQRLRRDAAFKKAAQPPRPAPPPRPGLLRRVVGKARRKLFG